MPSFCDPPGCDVQRRDGIASLPLPSSKMEAGPRKKKKERYASSLRLIFITLFASWGAAVWACAALVGMGSDVSGLASLVVLVLRIVSVGI